MKSSRPSIRGCGDGKFSGLGLELTGEFFFDVVSCCCNIGSMGMLLFGDIGDLTNASFLTEAWSISIKAGFTVAIGAGDACVTPVARLRIATFA